MELIIKFLLLTAFVSGTIIFILHRTLVTGTEGAVKRLNAQIAESSAKQAELSRKLKEADAQLTKRQDEAKQLADKMRADAAEESKGEREKIIAEARKEGEEIITKAQSSTEKMREELERELDSRGVEFGIQILNKVLNEKNKGALDQLLIDDFIANLRNMDMSKISPDVNAVEVITLNPVAEDKKAAIASIIKEKLNRDLTLNASTDDNLGGGVLLKFGSMTLDGSLRNILREEGVRLKEEIERR